MTDLVVKEDTVVRLKLSMHNVDKTFEEESGPDGVMVLIGHEDTFPAIEKALKGKKAGDKIHLKLEPEEAFGDYRDELLTSIPRSMVGDHVEVGMKVSGLPGLPLEDFVYTVVGESDDKLILDGNHELAGEAITVDMEILDIQEATPEEVEEMTREETSLFEVSPVDRSEV